MSGPCHFVVFGALGHLVTTKLLPSLYHLELAGRLDEALGFVAFATGPLRERCFLSGYPTGRFHPGGSQSR